MKRRSFIPTATMAGRGRLPTSWRRAALPVAVVALTLAACGGGGDDASSSTTTAAPPAPTTTMAAVTTTLPPVVVTTTTAAQVPVSEFVTDGAVVIVANSSGVNGAAGRLSEQLAVVGFAMGEATNGSEGQLSVTKIYFDPANDAARAVAESVRIALGGGDIQLFEMGVPAPVESGDTGDASVVVAMGNDTADKTLKELQGGGTEATPTTAAEDG